MGKGRAVAIELNDVVRRELTALTRKHGAPQALAERARIVLAAAGGQKNKEIASKLGICTHTVGTWRNRFAERGMDGLYDEPRPGAPREIGDDEIASTVRKTLETRPKGGTHWSLRSMAKEIGHAPSTVHRIWRNECCCVVDLSRNLRRRGPRQARMKAPEVSVDCMSRRGAATGNALAGGVASANENNTIKAKRKRFIMFPPNRCDGRNSWRDAPPTRPMNHACVYRK